MGSWRIAAVISTVLCAATAMADDADDKEAVPAPGRLRVFSDGKGHVLAASAMQVTNDWVARGQMFYGSSKELWNCPLAAPDRAEQIQVAGDRLLAFTSLAFSDPRVDGKLTIDRTTATVSCGKRVATFAELPEADAAKMIARASLLPTRFTRIAKFLARDDATYYYVDAPSSAAREYSLYVGKRNALKPVKIVDVASDAAGLVLVTAKGILRVTYGPKIKEDTITWGLAKRPRSEAVELVNVPIGIETLRFMFNDLGVYLGQRLGTPCDDV